MLQTIVFDLGNVLVRFSHERMFAQLGQLCGLSPAAMAEVLVKTELHSRLERGQVSEEDFVAELSTVTGKSLDSREIYRAGSDIFEPDPSMTHLLPQLKEHGLRLVLLSNTCSPHIRFIREQWDLLDHFDALVLSYEVGCVKPDKAIFEHLLEQIGTEPAQAFYTDDLSPFIATAREFGLQAETFVNAETFHRHLADRGVNLSPYQESA